MKLRNPAFLLLMLLAIVITGCTTAEESQRKTVKIGVAEAHKLIEKNRENSDFVIIDIRTPQEFSDGHIENAINIDFYSRDFRQKLSELDKNKTYLVYCRTGVRSKLAMPVFINLGFKEVYEMDGGIVAWIEAGYEVVK